MNGEYQLNALGGAFRKGCSYGVSHRYAIFSFLRGFVERGERFPGLAAVAERFLVSVQFVWKLRRDFVEGRSKEELASVRPEDVAAKKRGGVREGRVKMGAEEQAFLRQLVESSPELTLEELQSELEKGRGVRVSVSLICCYLKHRLGITRKVVHSQPLEQDTERVQRLRSEFVARWQSAVVAPSQERGRLFFQDESGVNSGIGANRRYGYAARGRPAVVTQSAKRTSQRHNVLATVGFASDGSAFLGSRVVHGKVDRKRFLEHLTDDVLPHLRSGDVLLMDNYSIHKGPQVREAVEATGARLEFIPPYSPQYNPIECVFGSMKRWLKGHKYHSRTRLGQPITEQDVGDALKAAVTKQNLQGWYRHCGYPME